MKLKIPLVMQAGFICSLELYQLCQVEGLCQIARIGGSLTSEEIEENKRRADEYEKRRAAIIKKHGLEEQYLKEHGCERERLEAELAKVMKRIALLTT